MWQQQYISPCPSFPGKPSLLLPKIHAGASLKLQGEMGPGSPGHRLQPSRPAPVRGHVCRAPCACMVGGRGRVGAAWAGGPLHSCWETLLGRDPTKVLMVCSHPVSFLPIPLVLPPLTEAVPAPEKQRGPFCRPLPDSRKDLCYRLLPRGPQSPSPGQAKSLPFLMSGPGLSLNSLLYVVRVTLKIFWESSGRPK